MMWFPYNFFVGSMLQRVDNDDREPTASSQATLRLDDFKDDAPNATERSSSGHYVLSLWLSIGVN
jgi:hypothetical protein